MSGLAAFLHVAEDVQSFASKNKAEACTGYDLN